MKLDFIENGPSTNLRKVEYLKAKMRIKKEDPMHEGIQISPQFLYIF